MPMTPVPWTDRTIVPVPDDPLVQNNGHMVQEESQPDPMNDGGQPAPELSVSSASPRLQLELSPNDHDWLLELCKN